MSTIISRILLNNPDLGAAGGSGLHSQVSAMFSKLGDNLNGRYLTLDALSNGASHDFEHNFKAAFNTLRYDLYLRDTGTGALTLITDLSNWVIAATSGSETTHVTVTNNTGSSKDISIVIIQDPIFLNELADVDTVTAAPQLGQALVWDGTNWVPGASGDASFKLQAVATPNLTLKGGYVLTPTGIEYATYSGSGSVAASYGVDLTLNLTTILGGSPANATTYYLCIDRTTVSTPATLTDSGRKLVQIVQANFVLLTTALTAIDMTRYIPLGFIKSATTGTVWSGSGSAFGTNAVRTADPIASAKYNKFVHGTIIAPNFYATLAAAIAAASAGDRILVLGGYTITAAETLSVNGLLVEFAPNVVVTINGAVKGLIVSASDCNILGARYISAFAGTVPAGIEVTGNDNNVERCKVVSNNAGTTITAAYNITGLRNRVTGVSLATLGTITDSVTDSGTGSDFMVRS